jgi:hypothetical protein
MEHDSLAALAPAVVQAHAAQPEAPQANLPAPSTEQVQAANEVFSRPQEQDLVAGLLGMQVGVLLLRDLAIEHFAAPADEEEQTGRKSDGKDVMR